MKTEILLILEKMITLGGIVVSIIISIFAIRYATKNNREQIIIAKTEEAYELTLFLFYRYQVLFFLHRMLESSRNESYPPEQRQGFLKNYEIELEKVNRIIDSDALYEKSSRLRVLANAYLKPTLKLKINSYCDLYDILLTSSLKRDTLFRNAHFKEGFPTQDKMFLFVKKLEQEFVENINLSSLHITDDKIKEFRDNQFKKELGLK